VAVKALTGQTPSPVTRPARAAAGTPAGGPGMKARPAPRHRSAEPWPRSNTWRGPPHPPLPQAAARWPAAHHLHGVARGPSRPSPAGAARWPVQRGTGADPGRVRGPPDPGSHGFRRYADPRWRYRRLPRLYLTFTAACSPAGSCSSRTPARRAGVSW